MRIAGAGLAGLIAAHAFPNAHVREPLPGPLAAHRAVLRFRSDAVAQLTGIEFSPVTVRKGLWMDGAFVAPSILLANLYSCKVLGTLAPERSIWNLDAAQRWIAPETFYEQLVEAVGSRIEWGRAEDYARENGEAILSTAPLPVVLGVLGVETQGLQFLRQPISVLRARVPRCAGVYQTIYFPAPETPVYRASITGDLLIVESVITPIEEEEEFLGMEEVIEAFGLGDVEVIDRGNQKYGKIVPLPSAERRSLLHRLTAEHGVFSVGRFATWRNVLLDDVVKDLAVVRWLLRASKYERQLFASQTPIN